MKSYLIAAAAGLLAAGSLGAATANAPLVTSIAIDPTSVDVTASSAPIYFTLQISAPEVGFSYGSLTLRGPSQQVVTRFFTDTSRIAGNEHAGTYQFSMEISRYAPPGQWQVSVTVTDSAHHERQYPAGPPHTLPGDDSIAVINNATVDIKPPAVTSFQISSNSVDVSAGPVTLLVEATVADDLSGLKKGVFQLYDPVGNYISGTELGDSNRTSGDTLSGTYQIPLTIPADAAQGVWTVRATVGDAVGNEISYGFAGRPPLPGPGSAQIAVVGAPPSAFQNFVTAYSLTGADALPNADPDHDGLPNALEMLIGSNPTEQNSSTGLVTVVQDGRSLELDFTVGDGLSIATNGEFLELRDGAGGAPLRVTGQTQTTLGTAWINTLPTRVSGQTYRVALPIGPAPTGFIRLFFQ